jgi:hypothetical protein
MIKNHLLRFLNIIYFNVFTFYSVNYASNTFIPSLLLFIISSLKYKYYIIFLEYYLKSPNINLKFSFPYNYSIVSMLRFIYNNSLATLYNLDFHNSSFGPSILFIKSFIKSLLLFLYSEAKTSD